MSSLSRRRTVVALVLVAALVPNSPSAWAAAPEGPAAPVAATARAAAERAALDVDRLVADLQVQLEAQQAAQLAVGNSVHVAIAADAVAQAASARAATARARQSRTVRALYTSGGTVAVFSSLLDSGSLVDLADRTRVAQALLQGAAGESERAARTGAEAMRSAGDEAQAADAEVRAAAEVASTTDAVEETLARARTALTGLTEAAETAEAAEAAEAAENARRQVAEAERLVALSRVPASAAPVAGSTIPDDFRVLYVQAAERCPGMRWSQLAAVGQVETRHGRNNGPSSAGAQGPMQFMPATFARYGVDGDGDGVADPWNPADAIGSAAVYLCVNGAGLGTPEAERRSLLRYNNAGWYVDLVQQAEAQILAQQG